MDEKTIRSGLETIKLLTSQEPNQKLYLLEDPSSLPRKYSSILELSFVEHPYILDMYI